jgi:hypothetical protein
VANVYNVVLISYDIKGEPRNYESVKNLLQEADGYLHCLESTWILCTTHDA